jgi:hypothetical protein
MLGWKRKTLWRCLARKLCAALTLLAYVTTAAGLPISQLPPKDRSQPFPCMDHACGCRSAEDCRRHCCCYSAEEKQAWARTHGLESPCCGEPQPARGWNNVRLRDQEAGKSKTSSGCAACRECETRSCAAPQSGRAPSGRTVSVCALRCGGPSTLWVSVGAVLPPPALLTWVYYPVEAERLCLANRFAVALHPLPPDPPPRLS